jgi:hypothetical protein
MPHLLAARTYVVLAVACLLGFGGGALLVAVDSPGILFYVLGVLLVGLYTMQALKPGAGVRPFRRRSTERLGRDEHGSPTEETQGQPSSTALEPSTAPEPSTGAEPGNRTVNYGLAGGHLDATKQLERARKTVRGPVYAMDLSPPMGQKVAAAHEVVAAGG